jgi:acetylglutamate kinase
MQTGRPVARPPRVLPAISKLGVAALAAMLPGLSEGMIPKMEACVAAVRGARAAGARAGRTLPHAVLLEILPTQGIGTMVLPDNEADPGEPAE